MPVAERFTITVTPLRRMVKFLQGNELYAEPWRGALKSIAELAENFVITRAPIRTGRLVAQMSHRVQAKPVPLYAVVKTTARNPRTRYGYARRLEFDPRLHHLAFFRDAVQASRGAWNTLLSRAASEIESRWRRL